MKNEWIIAIKLVLGSVTILAGLCLLAYAAFKDKSVFILPALAIAVVGGWLISGGQFKVSSTSIEARAESWGEIVNALKTSPESSSDLEAISTKYESGVQVWWLLLQYRIEIRTTLRTIAKELGVHLDEPDTSFTTLLKNVKERHAISDSLLGRLERIREYTYFAEWREGRPPDKESVKYVLENAKATLDELIKLKEEIRSKRSN